MKKMNTLLQLCLMVSAIFLFSCQNINNDKAKGTIGKVDKHHVDQMSENDLTLRSELLEDTTRLKKVLKGLMIHHSYINSLSRNLDNYINDYSSCSAENDLCEDIDELTSFRDYLNNSNAELEYTIYMFADIYADTVTESSFDIEQNLRNYMNVFSTLQLKAEIMEKIVESTDQWLKENEGKFEEEDLEQIKNVRDHVLISDLQMAGVLNNQDRLNVIYGKSLLNIENINAVYAWGSSQIGDSYEVRVNEELGILQVFYANNNMGILEIPLGMVEVASQAVLQANELQGVLLATGDLGSFIKSVSILQALEPLGVAYKSDISLGSVEEGMQALQDLSASLYIGSAFINSQQILQGASSLQNSEQTLGFIYTDAVSLQDIKGSMEELQSFNNQLSGNQILQSQGKQ